MSDQEQLQAIGQMTIERADAKKKVAILTQQIRDRAKVLKRLTDELTGIPDMSRAFGWLSEFVKIEDLASLRDKVGECVQLETRIQELSASLIAAGAE